jgi:basic amino acid/polyamine antiporter, APA family
VSDQGPSLTPRGTLLFGVSAIVGGSPIVLAGPTLVAAGPSALLAVLLNGVVAGLAALSLAELAVRFPRSGGAYAFAQRVFSVDAAFAVGWLVYFASLAATAVFALGFAEFARAALIEAWSLLGYAVPAWATAQAPVLLLALAAILGYLLQLSRRAQAGGAWLTVAKVATFALLGAAGVTAAALAPDTIVASLTPFAPGGAVGVIQAMALLFMGFQGFALLAAAAGEVRDPARSLPRAMFVAIAVATLLYLPLLFTLITVGVPAGSTLAGFAAQHGATMVAESARAFLGPAGFWLVTVTTVLVMLTALQANLFAASRIARAMARDRTLPAALAATTAASVPRRALLASALLAGAIVIVMPTIATAGVAAGLIYLAIFALAHVMALLARARASEPPAFRAPFLALSAGVGGTAAAALAILGASSVPAAGWLIIAWLLLGVGVYVWLFARQAGAVDAEQEGAHPELVQLRGRRPLVLAPIANPANAEALVSVAHALAPPAVGRVMLLTVVPGPGDGETADRAVGNAQQVLRRSLSSALALRLYPEAMTTVAADPWSEIGRVARTHDCEILLLGLSRLDDADTLAHLDHLIGTVRSDVVILRAPPGWHLEQAKRVVVPFGGRGDQERLRARVLGSLARLADPEVVFLRVLPLETSEAERARIERGLRSALAGRELGRTVAACVRAADPVAELLRRASDADLVILGLPKRDVDQAVLGPVARAMVAGLPPSTAVLMIHRR